MMGCISEIVERPLNVLPGFVDLDGTHRVQRFGKTHDRNVPVRMACKQTARDFLKHAASFS